MPSHKESAVPFAEAGWWFQTLADRAPVLIWCSGTDGLCTYFNQRWLQFTGRTLEESLGDGWVDDVHPDDRDRVLREYRYAFQARQEFRLEYRLRQQASRYKWIVDYGAPVLRSDGAFLGYIGACMDSTKTPDGQRETNWRERYENATADGDAAAFPERIAAAEVAISDRLDQTSNPEEQAALRESLARVLALKRHKLGFLER